MRFKSLFTLPGLSVLMPRTGVLIVRRRPFGDWLAAAFLMGLGVFFLSKGHRLELACARDAQGAGQCALVYTRLLAPDLRQTFPVRDLQAATPRSEGGGRGTEYRLDLLIDYRQESLSWPNSNVYREAERLNAFIGSAQPGAMRLAYDSRAFSYLMGGAVLLGALLWGLWRGVWYAEFDKAQGRVLVRKRTLLGAATVKFRRLEHIRGVEIEYKEPGLLERLYNRRQADRYRLELVLENNENLPLCPYYTTDLEKQQAAGEAIETFLRE